MIGRALSLCLLVLVLVFTTGGTDAPSEKQDSCMGPPMYYGVLGIPKTLQVLLLRGRIGEIGRAHV